MRFKQFLIENSSYSLEEVIRLIAKECKPFLSQSGDMPLFRGIKSDTRDPITFFAHPTSRKALDSSPEFNVMFNLMAYYAFGIKDVRKHTVFASPKQTMSSGYGNMLYYIFPRGDIKTLHSQQIRDSWGDASKIRTGLFDLTSELSGINFYQGGRNYTIINIFSDITEADWLKADSELKDNINRLFIETSENPEKAKDVDFYEVVNKALIKVGKQFYENNELKNALSARSEILLYESDGYYAISESLFLENDVTIGDVVIESGHIRYEKLIKAIKGI